MPTLESSASKNEALVNNLQRIGMIPGPQQFYVQFLTSQAGLATSLGDLIEGTSKNPAQKLISTDMVK